MKLECLESRDVIQERYDRKQRVITLWLALTLVCVVYVGIASMVFRFRHPWATETQAFLHIKDVVTFSAIPRE